MPILENKELIRRYFEYGSADRIRQMSHEEVLDWHTANFEGHGSIGDMNLEQYWKTIQMLAAAFPDFHNTIEDMVAEEDRVAVGYRFTGTHQGAFMGIPPSGKKIGMKVMAIYKIADGKLAGTWGVSDFLSLMQQIGAIPSGPVKQ